MLQQIIKQVTDPMHLISPVFVCFSGPALSAFSNAIEKQYGPATSSIAASSPISKTANALPTDFFFTRFPDATIPSSHDKKLSTSHDKKLSLPQVETVLPDFSTVKDVKPPTGKCVHILQKNPPALSTPLKSGTSTLTDSGSSSSSGTPLNEDKICVICSCSIKTALEGALKITYDEFGEEIIQLRDEFHQKMQESQTLSLSSTPETP